MKVKPINQRELVLRAQTGDAEAIGRLIELNRPLGERVARRMVSDPDVAQDIVQDAAIEVVLSIGHLRDPDRFTGWFCGIVLNLCRSHIRAIARANEVSLDFNDGLPFEAIDYSSTEPDPADALVEQEIRERTLEAVRELPASLRAPTVLHYLGYLTLREIAAGLGISVGNVKVRLHRARLRLRNRLSASVQLATDQDRVERRREMVKVKVFDVVNRIERTEAGEEQKARSVVVLVDEKMMRTLPIWTGRAEATAIALAVRAHTTPRPLTAAFMATLLRTAGVQVKEVRISRLDAPTYYAEVEITRAGRSNVIDARPSDAIALALHANVPILVADEIMQQASYEIPEEAEGGDRQPRGIEEVIAEVEKTFPPAGAHALTREEADRAAREFVREVFGGPL